MARWQLWAKALFGGAIVVVGGPALTMYVSPTEEELVKRYNPELRKRSIETRHEREQEFDDFVNNLKRYAKSDKPIWIVAAEEEKRKREAEKTKTAREAEDSRSRQEQMRKEAGLGAKESS